MPDLQKTIHRLKELRNWWGEHNSQTLEYEVLGDAIELLQEKAYNPSDNVAELVPLDNLKYYNLVWLEAKFLDHPLCVYVTGFREDNTVGFKVHPDEPEWFFYTEDPEGYNKAWRCWSTYPSYERRKEVEWLN